MTWTDFDVPCAWDGTLTGIRWKNSNYNKKTTKIIGIHGWLDNLNSMRPLAEKLIERHPNYEIYLYDRAGHGFSSHLPKGFDYSNAHNLQDLRRVIQTLRWNEEKLTIIGHSYGAILGMTYAAAFPDEVVSLIAIDAVLRTSGPLDELWKTVASRVDTNLRIATTSAKTYKNDLTMDRAIEITKAGRPGITDEAAKLLTERSVRFDQDNQLQLTRDEALKALSIFPFTEDVIQSAVQRTKASVLYIGALNSQWPRGQETLDLLQKYNPKFEMMLIDGFHHFHMTHVNEIIDHVDQHLLKYLPMESKL